MKYKAIIFDMDGTIIDTNRIWETATHDLITSKGGVVTPELAIQLERELKGLALHASCKFIKDMMNLEHDLHDLITEKQQRALELYRDHVNFIEGFKEFHKKVIDTQLKVGIATNADDCTLKAAIEKLSLKDFFGEHIYNIAHVGNRHKPAPDIYLHVADRLGIDPKECLAIEDSLHGIRAAVDAGMFCIGINTGKDREALKNAHLIVDRYDEICLKTLLATEKTGLSH